MHTKKIQHFAEAAFWPAALLRRASVLAEGQNLGAGGIHFRRACEVLTVSIKITTPKGVVIFMARGNNPNPLRSFAIFLEKHPTGLLAAAPLRRTSVLPQAKPWRRANSLRPSISITEGWSDQRERNPKRKTAAHSGGCF